MKKVPFLRPVAFLLIGGLCFLTSCDEETDPYAADTASVENEAATDAYFEDTDDMSNLAVAADNGTNTGGRDVSKGELDSRFACAGTTVTLVFAEDSTPQVPHGIITVAFGSTGCTDARENVRKGTIIIEFRGRRFQEGSTVVTTLVDYEINGIKLEGKRTVATTSALNGLPKSTVVLVDGKATWPDGTFATREVNRIREWRRKTTGIAPRAEEWTISGTATGTNRNGSVYELTISNSSPLVYKRECAQASRIFIAVEGTKELTVDGKKLIIDYGDGACDRLVRITTLGSSREVEVKGDI